MTRIRRGARILLATIIALLTFAGIAQAGMMTTMGELSDAPEAAPPTAPVPRPSAEAPVTVAVVLGRSETVGSDALAPYEVFASSSVFSVYTVAESAGPAPIAGAPSVLPTHTFADVAAGRAATPDVVVVPAVGEPAGEEEAALREWIAEQHQQGAHIFGVCSGSRVLAAAGVLDGRRATSHWSGMNALEQAHPDVRWVRGERYVQDGSVTTTAGITSGIPGALKVVHDLAGAQEAERVGRTLGYPGWSLNGPTAIPEQSLGLGDLPVGLGLVLPWMKPTVGVGLTEGVGEINLAAAFEAYATSYAARPVAIAADTTITTRHGLVLITTPIAEDPVVDRVVVPGATSKTDIAPDLRTWASDRNLPIDPLRNSDGRAGFDAALEDLATHASPGTALTVAKVIDYPVAHLDLTGSSPQWRMAALLLVAVALAVGMGLLPAAVRRAIRRRRAQPAVGVAVHSHT